MDRFIEVFAASDITFAYLLKANLEDAGIPVQITNENLQGVYCIDGMVPRVLVPERFEEQARQIIQEIQDAPAFFDDEPEDDYFDDDDTDDIFD